MKIKGCPIDADLLMLKVEEEYGFRTRDRLYEMIRIMPKYDLPSAQPQRMRGRWDFIGWNQYACTACRHQFYSEWLEGWATYTNEPPFPNYCPNCGAQME